MNPINFQNIISSRLGSNGHDLTTQEILTAAGERLLQTWLEEQRTRLLAAHLGEIAAAVGPILDKERGSLAKLSQARESLAADLAATEEENRTLGAELAGLATQGGSAANTRRNEIKQKQRLITARLEALSHQLSVKDTFAARPQERIARLEQIATELAELAKTR